MNSRLRIGLAVLAGVIGLMLAIPIVLLSAPFLLISALTRWVGRLSQPAHLTREQLIEYDPFFGWKPRPNLRTHHLMVDFFDLTTDAQGWRGRASLEESELVVFGDSFAAGYGVSEKHLFANLGADPPMKPIGIGGYSMVQAFLWMKRLAPQLRGKMVVWFIYLGNDLYDNLSPDLRGYRKPFVRENRQAGGWEIVSRHVSAESWPIVTKQRLDGSHDLHHLAELCRPTFLSARAYAACEFLIDQGRQVCAESGADPVVMTIPDPHQLTAAGQRWLASLGGADFDPNYPDRQIEAMCQRLGVRFVASRRFLDASCYKTNDCHWNPRGHRRVAKALRELFASRQAHAPAAPQDTLGPLAPVG